MKQKAFLICLLLACAILAGCAAREAPAVPDPPMAEVPLPHPEPAPVTPPPAEPEPTPAEPEPVPEPEPPAEPEAPETPLTADYSGELPEDACHRWVYDKSMYTQIVAIRANRVLKDFEIHATDLTGEGRMEPTGLLFSLPELTPEKPLLAYISFPGDITTYALLFSDESGAHYQYHMSQSGRDGSVFLADRTDP